MKGILCYYSGSGNTKLACQHLAKQINNAEFELCDIVKEDMPDFSRCDVAGFATFADFGSVSHCVRQFFEKMPPQSMPAYVFNTYGFMSLATLRDLAKLVHDKGFRVLGGYSLHTPENYPPMRMRNRAADDAPKPKELDTFRAFIQRLDHQFGMLQNSQTVPHDPIKIGLKNTLFSVIPFPNAKKDMGEQQVDESTCSECGTCAKRCPYGAIQLAPKPVFDHRKCCGCWACYNHCPEHAIHTSKVTEDYRYPKPIEALRQKLQ